MPSITLMGDIRGRTRCDHDAIQADKIWTLYSQILKASGVASDAVWTDPEPREAGKVETHTVQAHLGRPRQEHTRHAHPEHVLEDVQLDVVKHRSINTRTCSWICTAGCGRASFYKQNMFLNMYSWMWSSIVLQTEHVLEYVLQSLPMEIYKYCYYNLLHSIYIDHLHHVSHPPIYINN